MRRWGFGTGRRRAGVHLLAVLLLLGMVAVLAVGAQAGTSAPRLASVERAPAAPVGARALGAPAADASQSGYVVLKPRDEQSLKSFIAAVARPHSSLYHQYIRAGQFASRFGPSSSTIAAVSSQLRADGLRVTGVARDGLLIGFSGTTANVESAFGTRLERYRSAAGITGEQATRAISLPSGIAHSVAGVVGLNTLVHPQAHLVRAPRSAFAGHAAAKTASITSYAAGAARPCTAATNTASTYGGLTDDQIANAYGATPLYAAGDTGQGVNIGVYELEPFARSDLQTFDECYFGTAQGDALAAGVNVKAVDGGQPAGTGSGESILDIEDVAAMAPGAHIDVYEAPNTTAGSLDEYAQMVNDDSDQIITSSWGFCEQDLQLADPGAQQAENYIFEQAAAQGQTVLNAAGDTGEDTCNEVRAVPPPTDQNPLSVDDPASQPYVLGVGGTTIQDANPSNFDETVWNDGAQWGGGGGGISMSWAAPSWQQTALNFPLPGSTDYTNGNYVETHAASLGISAAAWPSGFCANNSTAGFSGTTPCRGVPDVSAQADEFTGAVTMYMASQGGWFTIGGTSSATPIWAAMLALVDASSTCSENSVTNIGFASPLLYAVAASATEYAQSFHDITAGNNDIFGFDNGKVFPARTGYDLATGLGSPILAHSNGTPGLAENLCNMAAGVTAHPTVSSITPSFGPVAGGTTLTVDGSGFGSAASPNVKSVTLGSDVIPYGTDSLTVVSDTQLTLTTPAATSALSPSGGSVAGQDGAGAANVVVTLNSGVSSPAGPSSQFSYVDESSGAAVPSVSSISPYAGAQTGGTPITIYGSGFATGDTVTVGGNAATSVTLVSPWEITAVTPAYPNSDTACVTESALVTELSSLSADSNPKADNICQTEVVVTDSSTDSSATTAPLPTYLGALPEQNQDGLLEVPNGFELSPVPDEFDYVPAPTVTNVAADTADDRADADPSSYAAPTLLNVTGTGLNYQTLNWLSIGDPTQASSQYASYPAYADGTDVEIAAPADPNGTPASGSRPDPVAVSANTLAGQSAYDSGCTNGSADCVYYAGIPEITAVATGDGTGAGPDTGGTGVTISGHGLSDVVGPLQFTDDIQYVGLPNFSIGSQYQYTISSDTSISTETVAQNPAIVDTYACSDSGCSAQSANDQLLLYPPGDPVITSIEDASGPEFGGTLVTINGENLGCVTSVSFGGAVAEAFTNAAALLDCGSSSQVVVVAPPGTAGQSVPITLTTVESLVTGAPAATSPTDFTYDSVDPSVNSALAFGGVDLGSASTQSVTLSNPTGATQPLYPGGPSDSNPATISGTGDFTIASDGCSGATLNPGQSCDIQVRFAPAALGTRSATLDIPWNESASVTGSATPDFTVPLSGAGVEPTVVNTVTTRGKTVTKRVTCTITVRWRWVTIKVHHRKKRVHKKFTARSKGCKAPARKKKRAAPKHRAAKPGRKATSGHRAAAERRGQPRG